MAASSSLRLVFFLMSLIKLTWGWMMLMLMIFMMVMMKMMFFSVSLMKLTWGWFWWWWYSWWRWWWLWCSSWCPWWSWPGPPGRSSRSWSSSASPQTSPRLHNGHESVQVKSTSEATNYNHSFYPSPNTSSKSCDLGTKNPPETFNARNKERRHWSWKWDRRKMKWRAIRIQTN